MHGDDAPMSGTPLLLVVVLTAAPPANPVTASRCLRPAVQRDVQLLKLRSGAVWYPSNTADAGWTPEEGPVGCTDLATPETNRLQLFVIRNGIAVLWFVDRADTQPLETTPANWKAWRSPVQEGESGQAGCLKRFARGTVLFDRPDGAAAAVVVDPSFLGKWDSAKTSSGFWAQVRGVREPLWVKQPNDRDWCD